MCSFNRATVAFHVNSAQNPTQRHDFLSEPFTTGWDLHVVIFFFFLNSAMIHFYCHITHFIKHAERKPLKCDWTLAGAVRRQCLTCREKQ